MDFGDAIRAMKKGHRLARKGWNGRGMWVIHVPGTEQAYLSSGTVYREAVREEHCNILPHIDMWTTDSTGRRAMLPGWLASQSDMLAEDWEIVTT